LKKLALACAFGIGCCFAQADRAAVTGTITDPAQAAIPNARVKIVFPGTGLSRETTTSNAGVFLLSALPIGSFYAEVSAAGFRTARTDAIVLSVGETRQLDLRLEVGAVESTVEVHEATEALAQNSAVVGDVLVSSQLDNLPVNGRDWKALMSLVPGAVDGQKFFGTGGDDVNFHVDGVDASGVRDQNMKVYTRDVMSQDAVAEFRVSTALYSADRGGTGGGQVEIVTKSGTNAFHGSAYEYFRNAIMDARSPFDPAKHPPFRLNQFGATLGGSVIKNKTFFFLAYEGFRQALETSLIGYVPTPLLRSQVLATSPVLTQFINAYPLPNAGLLSSQVGQWTGQAPNSENEDVGTIRVDHRFSDRFGAYFRFTRNYNRLSTPSTLGEPNPQVIAPTSGVVGLQYILSPRATNELRFGGNFIPWDALSPTQLPVTINPGGGLSSPAPYSIQVWHALSESIVDNFTTLRGKHTWKAGVEIRRPVLSLWATPGYSVGYASIADFITNTANTASGSAGKPARTQEKVEYFGYILDEWKIKPNLTANLGLRYEMFNEFNERQHRDLPFSVQYCGGYCKYGIQFGDPKLTNFAPRASLAWAPAALHDRTVIRVGGGKFYGDAQLGDQQSAVTNDGFSYSLTSATTPGLAFPVIVDPNNLPRTAPSDYDRHRKSEDFQEWGLQVQQLLGAGFTAQVGYQGIQANHLSSKSYINLINPITGTRPLAALGFPNQLSSVGSWSNSSYQGLLMSLQRTTRSGLFFNFNYSWSHALNEGSMGGGGPNPTEIVSCVRCDWGNSPNDQRHSLHGSLSYVLPFGRTKRWGGWSISAVNSFRTGLPLSVTTSRKATDTPDGNTNQQRPDVVAGVSLIPAAGQSINNWTNIAAFSNPAHGTWGNAGADIVRGPKLFQIDTALAKDTRLTESTRLTFRADIFNIFNHPELGPPNLNFSAPATFGRITSLLNTSPIGTGGCRSIQLALRIMF
jgi:hypothetical protein